ncbi:MAG: hypothetical protein ABI224_03140, partial [Acetobacteraceae bacterium]
NESYPEVFQPYGGFPDGTRVEGGHVVLPDLPGIGFEAKADLFAEMRALADTAIAISSFAAEATGHAWPTSGPVRRSLT